MKPKYQSAIDRFLMDQGGRFRFLRSRWWFLAEGYWQRDGRSVLEREITGFVEAFSPPQVISDLNQSDMNQICGFLARKLYTTALPGKFMNPEQDLKLVLWGARPSVRVD